MNAEDPTEALQSALGLRAVRTFLGLTRSLKTDINEVYSIGDHLERPELLSLSLRSLTKVRRMENILNAGLLAANAST